MPRLYVLKSPFWKKVRRRFFTKILGKYRGFIFKRRFGLVPEIDEIQQIAKKINSELLDCDPKTMVALEKELIEKQAVLLTVDYTLKDLGLKKNAEKISSPLQAFIERYAERKRYNLSPGGMSEDVRINKPISELRLIFGKFRSLKFLSRTLNKFEHLFEELEMMVELERMSE